MDNNESVQETTDTENTETTVDTTTEQTSEPTEEQTEQESNEGNDLDLQLPDGITWDEETKGQVSELMKEAGIKPEFAQKFVDLHLSVLQKVQSAYDQTIEGWAKESEKAYGDKKDEVLANAAKALKRFDESGELMKDLQQTGLGNKKAWIDLFASLGAQSTEGSFVEGNPAKQGGFLSKMYPTMK